MPCLKDNGSRARFQASGQAVVSAGPNLGQAQAHVVEGAFGTPRLTLALAPPRGSQALAVHAAAHVLSGSPPRSDVNYQIEVSVVGGLNRKSAVKDWTISRRGDEPSDFWSQSFCWGSLWVADGTASPVRVRFRNSGGRSYARAEAHLVYRTTGRDGTKVTFSWTDDRGSHQTSHVFAQAAEHDEGTGSWTVPTDRGVQT